MINLVKNEIHKMLRRIINAIIIWFPIVNMSAQTILFENHEFEMTNVKSSIADFRGQKVMKVERDLDKIPFDPKRLGETVDEPTFLKLNNIDFENGTIEVKVFSQLQDPLPFDAARGFIGLAFRINNDHSQFESIYLRPKNGRSNNQIQRNHTVQYFSYPNFKFEKLRDSKYSGRYETYADIDLNEWITMKVEVKGKKVTLYLNNQKYPSFLVDKMLGNIKNGSIGLTVDIGTIGYFKELKIVKY